MVYQVCFLIFFVVLIQIPIAINDGCESGSMILDGNSYSSQTICYPVSKPANKNSKMTGRFSVKPNRNEHNENEFHQNMECTIRFEGKDRNNGGRWNRLELLEEFTEEVQKEGGFIDDYLEPADKDPVQAALDEFTGCVLEESNLAAILPSILSETMMEIFEEECIPEAPSPVPPGVLAVPCPKECANDFECVKKCVDKPICYPTRLHNCGYAFTVPSAAKGQRWECYWPEEANASKCVQKVAPTGACAIGQDPLECGHCVPDTVSIDSFIGHGSGYICQYTMPSEKPGYDLDCVLFVNPLFPAGLEPQCREIRQTSYQEKFLNATINCLGQANGTECCKRKGVHEDCLPLCGAVGAAEPMTMGIMSACSLHMGNIMHCYVQSRTGKTYGFNEEECANACKICESIKSCSLPQFLPGAFGDFAAALCMLNANMNCQMAKMRGGCI